MSDLADLRFRYQGHPDIITLIDEHEKLRAACEPFVRSVYQVDGYGDLPGDAKKWLHLRDVWEGDS